MDLNKLKMGMRIKPRRLWLVIAVTYVAFCLPRWEWVKKAATFVIARQFEVCDGRHP